MMKRKEADAERAERLQRFLQRASPYLGPWRTAVPISRSPVTRSIDTPEAAAAARLRNFLQQAAPYLIPTHSPTWAVRVDGPRLTAALQLLKEPLDMARRNGAFVDPWAIARLGRQEVRTAGVLAWLLDTAGTHGAEDVYLRSLWAQVGGVTHLGFDLNNSIRALTENSPMGDDLNRIDIALEGADYFVVVEVKIDAPPRENQLVDYAQAARNKARLHRKEHWAMLYLSGAEANQPEGSLQISWKDVARSIEMAVQKLDPDSFSTRLATLFAKHVKHLH